MRVDEWMSKLLDDREQRIVVLEDRVKELEAGLRKFIDLYERLNDAEKVDICPACGDRMELVQKNKWVCGCSSTVTITPAEPTHLLLSEAEDKTAFKASALANLDKLEFYYFNVVPPRWSGVVGWTPTFSGDHSLYRLPLINGKLPEVVNLDPGGSVSGSAAEPEPPLRLCRDCERGSERTEWCYKDYVSLNTGEKTARKRDAARESELYCGASARYFTEKAILPKQNTGG